MRAAFSSHQSHSEGLLAFLRDRAFFKVIRAPSCRLIGYRKKAPRALTWMRFDELIDSEMAEKTCSKLNREIRSQRLAALDMLTRSCRCPIRED